MKLLFLTHRIPYPPNKGDKISSFNMLRFFSKSHDVYLGTFVDDPDDWAYTEKLADYCADMCIQPLTRKHGLLGMVQSIFSRQPLSIAYYHNKRLHKWVDKVLADVQPDAILMFSGCTAQFVSGKALNGATTIFDAEDVDSEKFRTYGRDKPWPIDLIYRREADLLLQYERKMAEEFSTTVFVSPEEATLFRKLCPSVAEKTNHRTQGVDTAYFDPATDVDTPYADGARALVFVGAMNYWPNIRAAEWYAKSIFPKVKQQCPAAAFYIVGLAPTKEVQALAKIDGVHVTGAVPDIRPYIKHAWAACLPLTIARGIQNKALEAMAMGKTLIATPQAIEGISDSTPYQPLIGATEDDLIAQSVQVLDAPLAYHDAGRAFVMKSYSWDANLAEFERLFFNK